MKFLSKDPVPADERTRRSAPQAVPEPQELNAFLGQGCRYQGKLSYEGTVRIDAQFSGEIFSDGTLIIGEGAEVDAEIRVATVIVCGKVVGNIYAAERLEMRHPARVVGNITSPCLVVEEGVLFEGSCRMGLQDQGAPASVEEVTEEEARALPLEPLGHRGAGSVA